MRFADTSTEEGLAILEVLVLGSLVIVVVVQLLVAAARIQVAGERTTEAAERAATWAARYGGADDARRVALDVAPDATVHVDHVGDRLFVVVSEDVTVVGAGSTEVTITVRGRAAADISLYRSERP